MFIVINHFVFYKFKFKQFCWGHLANSFSSPYRPYSVRILCLFFRCISIFTTPCSCISHTFWRRFPCISFILIAINPSMLRFDFLLSIHISIILPTFWFIYSGFSTVIQLTRSDIFLRVSPL